MKTSAKTILITLLAVSLAASQALAARNRRGRGRPDRSLNAQSSDDNQSTRPDGQRAGGGRHRPGPRLPLLRHLRQLDLTDQQRQDVRTILDDAREEVQAAHTAVRQAMHDLNRAVMDEADDQTIQLLAAAVGQAIGAEALLHVSIVAQIKDVLTEDQLTQLADILANQPEPGTPPPPPDGGDFPPDQTP